jgi:hypothetical protein
MYQFETSTGVGELRKGFVLPAQQKYLMDLDIETLQITGVRLIDVEWTRENAIQEIMSTREVFSFEDVIFSPRGTEEIPTSSARFTITNNSNFNYYNPTFQIFLRRGGSIVAVQEVTLDFLRSGQSRALDVRWIENIPSVQSVDVVPIINYISEDAYLDF